MGGAPGELGHCTHCGQGLSINLPQSLSVISAACLAFAKDHARCVPGQYHPKPTLTPQEWEKGRDTGISSLTIYHAITGLPRLAHAHGVDVDIPHDPDDFGRCYRLLKLFPAWRGELGKVTRLCPRWKKYVENWNKLTELYEQELAKKIPEGTLYGFMKTLQGRAA